MSNMEEYQIQLLRERLAVEVREVEYAAAGIQYLEEELASRKRYLAGNPPDSAPVRADYRRMQARFSVISTDYKRRVARAEGLKKRIEKEIQEYMQKTSRSLTKKEKATMRGFNVDSGNGMKRR